MRRCEVVDTMFQKVEVWKSAHAVEFRVSQAVHAWWHETHSLTGLAWDNMVAGCMLHPNGKPQSVLMLGLAGGTTFHALRRLLPDVKLVAVDIDGVVVDLARRHMRLDDIGCEIHIADAYEWVAKCKQSFDVVIDDVYLAGDEDVYRPENAQGGGLELLRRRLNQNGLLLTNLVRGSGHRKVQSAMRKLYKKHFPRVREVRTPDGLNETLVGGPSLPESALAKWRSTFSSSRDKVLWDKIRVKNI